MRDDEYIFIFYRINMIGQQGDMLEKSIFALRARFKLTVAVSSVSKTK